MNRTHPIRTWIIALLLLPLSFVLTGCPMLCLLGLDLCDLAEGPIGYGLVQQPTCTVRTPNPNGELERLCGRGEVCQFIQQNGKFGYDGTGDGRGSEVAREWTAENAAIVTEPPGIEVCTAGRVLQFVATAPDGPSGDTFSEVVQLIPLSEYRIEDRTVRARMLVNRLDQDIDTEFVLSLRAMAGDPAEYSREERDNYVALNFFRMSSDFDQSSWEIVEAELSLPPGTDYLAVEIAASENVTNETSAPEFAGQYADHVEVALVQPPGSYDVSVELEQAPPPPFVPGNPVSLSYRVRNLGPQFTTAPIDVAFTFGDRVGRSDLSWSIPPFTPSTAAARRDVTAGSGCDASPSDPVAAYDVTAEIVSGLGVGDDPSNNRVVTSLRPQNFPPASVDDVYQVEPGVPLAIPPPGLLANDTDPESDGLSIAAVSEPIRVSEFDLQPDGGLTVTLEPDFSSAFLRFPYATSDGTSESCGADVFLIVGSGPVVIDGLSNQVLDPGADPVSFDLTDRFLDPNDEVLAYSAASEDPAVLTVAVDGSTLILTPLQEGPPVDVTVTAADPGGNAASFTFNVVVGAVNDPPVVVRPIADQTLDVTDPPLTIDLASVFGDPEGDPLSYGVTVLDGDDILEAAVDGSMLTVTPLSPGGPVRVFARAWDGFARSAGSDFFVTVTGTGNLPPVAVDDSVSTSEATPVLIDVVANDFDPDGDAFQVLTISTPPSNGTVETIIPQPGVTQVRYTPDAGFTGVDTFGYDLFDVAGNTSNEATVTVTVLSGDGT
jgi:hypothetical protein